MSKSFTRQALAAVCISLAPALTGCLVHTRSVPKVRPADVVLNANLDQLISQTNARYESIQTMSATVEIQATVGGGHNGQVTDYAASSGYIFVRKPEDIRVLMKVPLLGSTALDMVSNGKTWKLWSPPKNLAIEGTSQVTTPSKNPLENLRPAVFFDSLLVRSVLPTEIVSPTSDVREIENPKKKQDIIEEPDYDLEVLTAPKGQVVHTLRVVHISRSNLLPYQQDLYNDQGQVVTRAFYSEYQKFGDIMFPTHILIRRPLDQLSLSLTISKLTFNQKLDDDQFELSPIPAGITVKKID
jgi:outer membrane lipoprotein-sorting protein